MVSNSLPLYEVNFEVPKEHQSSFQTIFAYIKKKIQIKNKMPATRISERITYAWDLIIWNRF